jgi:hypothetical protein
MLEYLPVSLELSAVVSFIQEKKAHSHSELIAGIAIKSKAMEAN